MKQSKTAKELRLKRHNPAIPQGSYMKSKRVACRFCGKTFNDVEAHIKLIHL